LTVYLNPKTGATQGSPENHGTQAEPFTVAMAWQPSTLSFVALSLDASGNLNTAGGGGGGGGAATIADGADVAEGATTDAAVVTDVAGTVSGKLRGLVKILASVWDSVNGRLKVDGSGVTQPISNANLDVALSTRLKPADTLTKVATVDTITNPVTVSGTVTANQGGAPWSNNISQYGGVAVGAANAVHVQPGTGASFLTTNANLDVALSTRLKPADTLAAVTSLTQFNGQAIALNTGVRSAGTLRVTVATDDSVPVTNANLDVALSTRLKPADTLTKVATVDTITNAVTVGSVSTSVTPGTAAANLGKAEDAVHGSGDTGVMSLGVRNDTLTVLTSANGDYSPIAVDQAGQTLARETPTTTIGTTLSGANATVTLTLAAAGAGLFHYITAN
jgi:hypothetical protein